MEEKIEKSILNYLETKKDNSKDDEVDSVLDKMHKKAKELISQDSITAVLYAALAGRIELKDSRVVLFDSKGQKAASLLFNNESAYIYNNFLTSVEAELKSSTGGKIINKVKLYGAENEFIEKIADIAKRNYRFEDTILGDIHQPVREITTGDVQNIFIYSHLQQKNIETEVMMSAKDRYLNFTLYNMKNTKALEAAKENLKANKNAIIESGVYSEEEIDGVLKVLSMLIAKQKQTEQLELS